MKNTIQYYGTKKGMSRLIMRTLAVILFGCIILSSSIVTAFAAEPAKTIDQRIADIKETYGIEILILNESWNDSKTAEKALTQLESALGLLGSSFTKKIVSAYEDGLPYYKDSLGKTGNGPELGFKVVINASMQGAVKADFGDMSYTGQLQLISEKGAEMSLKTILHEFGHALQFATATGNPSNEKARGAFENYTYTGRKDSGVADGFVSSYARHSWGEDYAETFAYMVISNEDYKLTSGTGLYKKGKSIYDDLVSFVGTGSRATQRVANNLGIEIKTDK